MTAMIAAPARSRPPAPPLATALAALLLAGCGGGDDDGPALVPTRGTVLVGGRPAAGAFVVFHPDAPLPEIPRPNALVGPDGSFALSTFATADGAPAGSYAVTVEWRPGLDPTGDSEPEVEPEDLLRGRYADPAATSIRAEVAGAGAEATVPPIELPAPGG